VAFKLLSLRSIIREDKKLGKVSDNKKNWKASPQAICIPVTGRVKSTVWGVRGGGDEGGGGLEASGSIQIII